MGARKAGDYPRTLGEFPRRFPDDEACLRYLVETRWPDGFRCPSCGGREARVRAKRTTWVCRSCRRHVSPTAATILHRSKLPLTTWFAAAYIVASLKPGISALQLQWQLGLSRYETAWLLLHKLRRAMVDPDRPRLSGTVEVDEAWVGGAQAGHKGGRQRKNRKALMVGVAIERRAKSLGRLRLEVVRDDSADTLTAFVGVGVDHLDHYHNGFVFRFNRRYDPMAGFATLLGLGTIIGPTTGDQIRSPLVPGATTRRRGRATGLRTRRFSLDIVERPAGRRRRGSKTMAKGLPESRDHVGSPGQ